MENQDTENLSNQKTGVRYRFGDPPADLEGACRRVISSDETFNAKFERDANTLNPGDVAFQDDTKRMLVTTVGAGVVLTIYDDVLRFGVMACPLLTPDACSVFPQFDKIDASSLQKIIAPIDAAINEMKKHGAGKSRVRVRLFGGANLSDDGGERGTKNYVFVKEYLSRKGIKVMGEDIGGSKVRRIHFVPDEGSITRFVLKRQSDVDALCNSEREYFTSL